MGNLVKGTHHIALRANDSMEKYDELIRFYTEVLQMPMVRTWGEGLDSGAMVDIGNSMMELFAAGAVSDKTGSVNHIAFATDDVDACIEAARAAGYQITIEPNDIVIGSAIPYPARIGFCIGPVGEEIEFFCEK